MFDFCIGFYAEWLAFLIRDASPVMDFLLSSMFVLLGFYLVALGILFKKSKK